jgi:hypothetical protein
MYETALAKWASLYNLPLHNFGIPSLCLPAQMSVIHKSEYRHEIPTKLFGCNIMLALRKHILAFSMNTRKIMLKESE